MERHALLSSEKSSWRIILAPGRIWSEPGDKGYSRASFPFTLVGSKWLGVNNGVSTFLFNRSQASALRFQIIQESAPGRQFDAWGQAAMTYLPSLLPAPPVLAGRFEDELAHQIPVRPWAKFERTYDW
ncbi:MAG: hypothetical protein GY866_17795 [Proteobacteria bacterium]|nr:hypothetical protein [Pseudomonadota bacterium]